MTPSYRTSAIKTHLDRLYDCYNARQWVHPDPLETLYDYPRLKDREVAAIIASCLAYGRVAQILKSVRRVLQEMGPSPHGFVSFSSPASFQKAFGRFKHRFTTGEELVQMLVGIRRVVREYGGLYACFLAGYDDGDETVLPALCVFVKQLLTPIHGRTNSLLPHPWRGSACKRLNLFLRWMVREDKVDPGGWREVNPSKLIVPLDTHMHRLSTALRLTCRNAANMQTAIEITQAFRTMAPHDPVRYDFALTRLGIHKDSDKQVFLNACAA